MNLLELKNQVDQACESAREYGDAPENIVVSVQFENGEDVYFSCDVGVYYDNDVQASGCVLRGIIWPPREDK